jgi:protein arginine kinase activator
MKCERCKKVKANFHVCKVKDGKVRKTHYCSECADKKGLLSDDTVLDIPGSSGKPVTKADTVKVDAFPKTVGDLLSTRLDDFLAKAVKDEVSNNDVCPACGNSKQSFLKKGLFGCPECYVQFADAWIKDAPKPPEPKDPVSLLKKQLDIAVKKEEYEQAARIRDDIAKLEKEKSDKSSITPSKDGKK